MHGAGLFSTMYSVSLLEIVRIRRLSRVRIQNPTSSNYPRLSYDTFDPSTIIFGANSISGCALHCLVKVYNQPLCVLALESEIASFLVPTAALKVQFHIFDLG